MAVAEKGRARLLAEADDLRAVALVDPGDILQAQYRLGHRDASTTLRIYVHACP